MAIELLWPDGHHTSGPSWGACLDTLRREQWHRYTRGGFRKELAARAQAWSGKQVDTDGTDEEFCRALSAAGLFRIKHE